MNKRKTDKGRIEEEINGMQWESYLNGSVLENHGNSGVKNRKTRKCKVQGSNKTSTILKSRNNSKSTRIPELSCDSIANEEVCSFVKEDEPCELNDKNMVVSPHKSHDNPIENKSDTLPGYEESLFKINGNKYSELLNIFNGKEEDFNDFIKHYNIWQQSLSKSEKKSGNKKKVPKSPTLKKSMKSKIPKGTPVIKLTSPSSKKLKKDINKKSVTDNVEHFVFSGLKEKADIPVCLKPTHNPSILNTEDVNDIHLAVKTENVGSTEVPSSNNGQLDVVQERDEETLKEKVGKESVLEHQSIITNDNFCIVEAVHRSENDLINDEVKKPESIENSKLSLDFPTSLNSMSIVESLHNKDFVGVESCDPDKCSKLENSKECINQDKCDSHENTDFITQVAFSEAFANDSSKSYDTTKSPTGRNFNSIELKMQECLVSNPCISLNTEDNESYECEVSSNIGQLKTDDKDNLLDIAGMANSNLKEREVDTEYFSKRKRNAAIEKSDYTKRTKTAVDTNESQFFELKKNKLLSDFSCNKWNAEEANLLSEELIYSDEEKNDLIQSSGTAVNYPGSAEEFDGLLNQEDRNYSIEYTSVCRSDESLLDLHERKFMGNSDSCHIGINNTFNDAEKCFQDDEKCAKTPINTGDRDTPLSSMYIKWKDKKKVTGKIKNSNKKLKKETKTKEKVIKISSKCRKLMKNKLQRQEIEENDNGLASVKDLIPDEINNDSLFKKLKKKFRNSGHNSILRSDLPIVEVTYKGESLHGILGSEHSANLFKVNYAIKNKESKEDPLNSSHTKDVLKQFLHPLCCEMLRNGACNSPWSCKKEHMVHKDFFSKMNKYDAWLIIAFVLRISNNISGNFIEAILEFLCSHKAKKKVLLVSRHILLSKQNEFTHMKSCWEEIFKVLECCGLQRWEAMKAVVQFIIDTCSTLEKEVLDKLLKVWNLHGSTHANTWSIVEPLVIEKKIVLSPSILSKIIGEIMAVEPEDKMNVYRILAEQLNSLSQENMSQISYRLLNDFLRKLSQEGLHNDEKMLREKMNVPYYSPFCPQQSPLSKGTPSSNISSLRRCKSLTNLTNVSSDSNFVVQTKVHEEEKMEAAIFRALQCSNYDSVIKVIINCFKKKFLSKILFSVYKFIMDKHSYTVLKNMLAKLQEYPTSLVEGVKDVIGNIVVTVMLDYVKQYNWKEANNYFLLLEENSINKYELKSLSDGTLRPVRLAVTFSEVHYYNGRFKESIGVFISMKLINPDSSQWLVPGGSKDDFNVINVMVSFLMHELMNKKVINIATMLFKAVLEVQTSLSAPIDIGGYYEMLLYRLFEMTDEYPETAVKLYIRVSSKDSNISLYGLTCRALIILAYRTHRRSIIKDLFYKAIDEYAYPIIEENENVIMLLKSHTEEEIIVYITEWVARFKEKQSKNDSSTSDHQIQIKFKDVVLEDFLDDQVLGIPAILKEIDQSLPGAIKRLEFVLRRLHIKFKQIKKDTLSIEPLSFQIFFTKIKI